MKSDARRERGALAIPIHGIEERVYPFKFDVTAEELDITTHFGGEVSVEGSVSRVGSQYHVTGRVKASRVGECDRCLVETEEGIEQDFQLIYSAGEDSDEESGLIALSHDAHDIMLDDEVRQVLRLEIPLKNLCSEECAGLCPSCGADLNTTSCECETADVDPRWAKLKSLFGDEPDKN